MSLVCFVLLQYLVLVEVKRISLVYLVLLRYLVIR